MAKGRWTGSYPFLVTAAAAGAREVGIEWVLSPILGVEIANIGIRKRFYALVDSGADYSFLPYEAAIILGIEPRSLPGSTIRNQGIGGTVDSRMVVLGMGLIDPDTDEPEIVLELPFVVPLMETGGSDVVLIGRHPFFDAFDVDFRMGFTDDPKLGKWVLHEVTTRRDSRRYKPKPRHR